MTWWMDWKIVFLLQFFYACVYRRHAIIHGLCTTDRQKKKVLGRNKQLSPLPARKIWIFLIKCSEIIQIKKANETQPRLIWYQVINENILTIGVDHLVAYKHHCQCFLSGIPSALIPPRWSELTTADLTQTSSKKKLKKLLHASKTFDRNTNRGKLSTACRAIKTYLVLKYLKKVSFWALHDYLRNKSLPITL